MMIAGMPSGKEANNANALPQKMFTNFFFINVFS